MRISSQTIDPSRIRWDGNGPKREADQMLYRAIAMDVIDLAWRGPIEVLSLPGASFHYERGLSRTFPSFEFRFTGLERHAAVFRKLKAAAAKLGPNYRTTDRPESFGDFAAKRDRRNKQFGIIYLDWMGTWSREKQMDLDALFAKDMLKVGGLLIMTLSLRRGRPETNDALDALSQGLPWAFYDASGKDTYFNNKKVRGVPRWVESLARDQYDVGLRTVMSPIYHSKTGVSDQTQPQLQIVMLRES